MLWTFFAFWVSEGYAGSQHRGVCLGLAEHFEEVGVLGVDDEVSDELVSLGYCDAEVARGEETGFVEEDFFDAQVDFLGFFAG